ncbi:MAG: hypothetical protein LBR17_07765, partial [Bacteroidales bacterium]|nr:hypothetical protein [Bacteroidales bacterium]
NRFFYNIGVAHRNADGDCPPDCFALARNDEGGGDCERDCPNNDVDCSFENFFLVTLHNERQKKKINNNQKEMQLHYAKDTLHA